VAATKAAMSFVVSDGLQIVGVFGQNGLQTIKPGAKAQISWRANPGQIYDTTVEEIAGGIGEGEIASSGTLTRVTSLPTTSPIDVPKSLHRRIKTRCAEDGEKMADVLRALLEERFSASS
jgi:hypothetical protein